jgi:hypothetical protein
MQLDYNFDDVDELRRDCGLGELNTEAKLFVCLRLDGRQSGCFSRIDSGMR